MGVSERFGRILTTDKVVGAIETHLKSWLVVFLAEMERQLGLDPRSIAPPASYESATGLNKFDENRLPSVIISVSEVQGEPIRYGDGKYSAVYPAAIAVVVGGRTPSETERNAQAYGAAVRGAMLYCFSGGSEFRVSGIKWIGESYEQLPSSDRRTKAASMISFDISIEDVVTDYRSAVLGVNPPIDPYELPPDWDYAEDVDIDVNP